VRLVLFEMNEVPTRVLNAYASFRPRSFLGRKMASNDYFETRAYDLDEELLYPSQAWASLNTGKPFAEHKIKWFSDPKNFSAFFWHRAMKSGKDVVVVGTPHSSPVRTMMGAENFKLLIPDFFSDDESTIPRKYMPLQKFNLRASMQGRRANNKKEILLDGAKSFFGHPDPSVWGLERDSFFQLLSILKRVFAGNRESLRMAQFPLFASIFSTVVTTKSIDLAILFTNHVASAMHRYLHAVPGLAAADTPYSADWRNKYQNEVFYALDLLDFWVSKVADKLNDRPTGIVITSAIGQKLNKRLTSEIVKSYTRDYRLERPQDFLSVLGLDCESMELIGAMLPQYSFRCKGEKIAQEALDHVMKFSCDRIDRYGHYTNPGNRLRSKDLVPVSGLYLHADRNLDIFTLSVMVQTDSTGRVRIDDKTYKPTEIGFTEFEVEDHHSGEHSRDGIVIHHNVPKNWLPRPDAEGYVDYLLVRGFYERILSSELNAEDQRK